MPISELSRVERPSDPARLMSYVAKQMSAISSDRMWLKCMLGLVVFASIIPRLNHVDKSIWTAEAWVANSVLSPTLWQMFHYGAWLQTTPALFLVLDRLAVRAMGPSVESLRSVPFALGVLSVLFMGFLSYRVLRSWTAVVTTTLVALSPPAVVFSKEVKHYTGDVVSTLIVLTAAWLYYEQPVRRRYLALLFAVTVATFLSYPAVCFVPLAAWVVFKEEPVDIHESRRTFRAVILVCWSGALSLFNYVLFVRPNSSHLLADYWRGGFPPFESVRALVHFYLETFLGMGIYFYLPIGTKDTFKDILLTRGYWLLILAIGATTAAGFMAFQTLKYNQRYRQGIAFSVVPVLTLATINAFHIYPVNSRRLTLFLLPCVALGTGILIQCLWEAMTQRCRSKNSEYLGIAIAGACVIASFIAGLHSDQWSNYWFEDEDTRGAFHYLAGQVQPSDTVYVHASVAEPAKLYEAILKWNQLSQIRYGNTGWPCCTRTQEPTFADQHSEEKYVVSDFDRAVGHPSHGRLWLVFTGRESHWSDIGRNESEIIQRHLMETGCRKSSERSFAYEVVEQFTCEIAPVS